jgi:hypothetical protein
VARPPTDEQLSNEWLSGKSPGLTDIQRLINLSILLRSMGDIDSLLDVYKELKEKSGEKPISPMIKQHIMETISLSKRRPG